MSTAGPRPKVPEPRKLTLGEQIEAQIEQLYPLLAIANNERRNHHQSNELMDGLAGVGRTLIRLGRG